MVFSFTSIKIKLYDKKNLEKYYSYTSIYNALSRSGKLKPIGLKRVLSCEFSGLISHLSSDPKQKIDNFFNYFKEETHVPPKRPKTLNTRGKQSSRLNRKFFTQEYA